MIAGIQQDFNKISEHAQVQSEFLEKKVRSLVEDLEHSQAAVNVQEAGQELMAKREMDAYRGKIGNDLQKAKVKIEKLERQLKFANSAKKDFGEELEQLKSQCDEYQ